MAAIAQAAQRENWAKQYDSKIVAVISNTAAAAGLQWAQAHGIATAVIDHKLFANRQEFDAALAQKIDTFNPSLVVLAGFMRILTPEFVTHYAGKIINIHPSLLPAFTGTKTHQRAIDAGCNFAGATVHWVIPELDSGKIIAQAVVPILENDTAEALAARVLSQEHPLYVRAIKKILPQLSESAQ